MRNKQMERVLRARKDRARVYKSYVRKWLALARTLELHAWLARYTDPSQ